MPYVTKDGAVVHRAPFSLYGLIMGFFNFFYLWFQTLIDPKYSSKDEKYKRDFRPGGGPPKPPSRRFGGFGPSSSGPAPPPMGGGCGCG